MTAASQIADKGTGHQRLYSEVSTTLTHPRALLLQVWSPGQGGEPAGALRRADPDLPVNQSPESLQTARLRV